jgi:hypothetical protein
MNLKGELQVNSQLDKRQETIPYIVRYLFLANCLTTGPADEERFRVVLCCTNKGSVTASNCIITNNHLNTTQALY